MKRDPEILRQILLTVEEAPAGESIHGDSFSDFEDLKEQPDGPTVREHVRLLIEDHPALLQGFVVRGSKGQPSAFVIHGLTSAGHDFLDATRNNQVWKKVLGKVASTGGAFTLDLLMEYAKAQTRVLFLQDG